MVKMIATAMTMIMMMMIGLDAVVKLVECKPRVWKIREFSSQFRIKPMTYTIYTYCFLAWRSTLIG